MKKGYLLGIFTVLCVYFLNGQNRFEEAVKAALHQDQYFADYDFFGTSVKDSLSAKDQFELAETARRMTALRIAEAAYKRTIRLDTVDGKIDYPSAFYQVGAMKKFLGDYGGALTYFKYFLSIPPPIDNDLLTFARRDIEDCKFAIERTEYIDNQYEVSHLGSEVNTPYNDFAPILIGEQFYFSSLKYQKEEKVNPPRLYSKALSTDGVQKAKQVKHLNQGEKSIAHLAFSEGQQRMYFTVCDYAGKSRIIRCKIYYKNRIGENAWSEAIPLPETINRKGFTATHPSVAYDKTGKELLFFSSDCPGGQGKMDIWFTTVKPDGTFTTPTNFVKLNTEGNDLTPFFHRPSNVLYFSSDGRVGLGGYDIYYYEDGEIKHGGYPLNSSFHDTHFSLDASGDKGYFSSSREGCMRLSKHDLGCQDIYEAKFINITAEVLTFDDLTKKSLEGVTLKLYQLPEAENAGLSLDAQAFLVEERTNNLDNQFYFDKLVRDQNYILVAKKEGYINDTLYFDTQGITESVTIKKELYLKPDIIEVDLAVLLFDDDTRLPLTNCIVQLIDLETEQRLIKDNIKSNDFYFDIYSQREYRLIASLIGYTTDTLDFNTRDISKELGSASLTKRMYLKPGGIVELDAFLPLTLYFDNDRPDSGTSDIKTDLNYEELYAAYYRRKREFITKYTKGISELNYASKYQEITDFFETDLKGNYDTLGLFSETLIKYLQRGNTAVISIRGFASPLAAADYNNKLGRRRVNCIMNHFATYRDGMLMRYIENGSLVLQEISFGESKAPNFISENPRDRQNSVYSPEASRERKVQIVEITIGAQSQGE